MTDDIRWRKFDLTDLLEMKVDDRELSKVSVAKGDLVICEGGEPGRAAIWNNEGSIVIQKALHRFRCGPYLIPEFALLSLETDYHSGRLVTYFTGATIKHLTGKFLVRYSLPVPPVEEQEKIIAKVDQLMSICDRLGIKFLAANKKAELLAMATIATITPAPKSRNKKK